MKTAVAIWAVALVVAVTGTAYMCSSSTNYVNLTVQPVNDSTLSTEPVRIVGVESLQGGEDNTGVRLQPANVSSLDYARYTIVSD